MTLSNTHIFAAEVHWFNTRFAENQNFFQPSACLKYSIAVLKFALAKIWETILPGIESTSSAAFKR